MTDRLADLKQDVETAIQSVKVENDPVPVAINVRPETGETAKKAVEKAAKVGENKETRQESGRGAVDSSDHTPNQQPSEEVSVAPNKGTTSPAYQFYPDKFLTDDKVLMMSFTEIGIYQVLLCHAWPHRGLPNDIAAIAKMLKIPLRRFEKIWAGPVGECFSLKGGRFVNPRQEKEREKQAEYRRRQSDNAAKGWQSRGSATALPSHPSGIARALETETETESSSSVVDQKKKEGAAQFRADHALRELQALYHQGRVTSGYRTESAFIDALGSQPAKAYAQMVANLENHKRSHEWRVKGFVPSLEKWLRDGLWLRLLPEDAPPGAAPSWEASLPEWAQKARAAKAAKS